MEASQIHSQLLADCHNLGSLPATQVLLHRNAALPWFILVPDTRMQDVLDLPDEHRKMVMTDCAGISAFIKQTLGFDKVNFAGLGNVVPQMHLHVIGRSAGDGCWPQPVWGNLPDGGEYTHARLLAWQADLQMMLSLVPEDLPESAAAGN
jgi:diadenosine tetraphosphate (Ap4A) HIT family hydrolase